MGSTVSPVDAEIEKYGGRIPHQWTVPGQIAQTEVVVDVNVGPMFNSSTDKSGKKKIKHV